MERIDKIINKIKAIKAQTVINFVEESGNGQKWFDTVCNIMGMQFSDEIEAKMVLNLLIYSPELNDKENIYCSLMGTDIECLNYKLRALNKAYIFEQNIKTKWFNDYLKENNININKYSDKNFIEVLFTLNEDIFSIEELTRLYSKIEFTKSMQNIIDKYFK
jgi:hypothetical protein